MLNIATPLFFCRSLFGCPPKRKAEGKQLLSRRTQHHVCTRPKDGEGCLLPQYKPAQSVTPEDHAARLRFGLTPRSYNQTTGGSGLSISPGVSAGRSETAPGISDVTHSAGEDVPQGLPPHRLVLPLLYSASEGAAAGAECVRRK